MGKVISAVIDTVSGMFICLVVGYLMCVLNDAFKTALGTPDPSWKVFSLFDVIPMIGEVQFCVIAAVIGACAGLFIWYRNNR